MSEGWNIAILGATGAVGEALLETLAERQFPVGEIYALARHESAGEHLRFWWQVGHCPGCGGL
ncbi:semialdehyde dehydrogenase [Salmonella enterica subsp. enterica serovar Heidelberg]|nr:semialdehyde dehydrogenase [Salmonella enterica subsp. enterica serovar Heidelberg]